MSFEDYKREDICENGEAREKKKLRHDGEKRR